MLSLLRVTPRPLLRGTQVCSRLSSTAAAANSDALSPIDTFSRRHIGPSEEHIHLMLNSLSFSDLPSLISSTVPPNIRMSTPLTLDDPLSESEALLKIRNMSFKNRVMKSFIGQGYHSTIVPPVILRNMLENPGWYTAYTPYQAEIAQGRLEMLLNFQTLCSDLTGLEMSVASLLDEASAAAEAMSMCVNVNKKKRRFFISQDVHPQTIGLIQTRAAALGVDVVVGDHSTSDVDNGEYCGVLVQYPNTYGSVESGGESYESFAKRAKGGGAMVICATDLMALTKLAPPSTWWEIELLQC